MAIFKYYFGTVFTLHEAQMDTRRVDIYIIGRDHFQRSDVCFGLEIK